MSSASWWKWNCRVGDQRSMVLMVLSSVTILVLYTKINLVRYTDIILDSSCQEPNLARSRGARDCLLLFAFTCNEVLTSVGLYRQKCLFRPSGVEPRPSGRFHNWRRAPAPRYLRSTSTLRMFDIGECGPAPSSRPGQPRRRG